MPAYPRHQSHACMCSSARHLPITEAKKPSCAVRPTKTCNHVVASQQPLPVNLSIYTALVIEDPGASHSAAASHTSFFFENPNPVVPEYFCKTENLLSADMLRSVRHPPFIHKHCSTQAAACTCMLTDSEVSRACIERAKGLPQAGQGRCFPCLMGLHITPHIIP